MIERNEVIKAIEEHQIIVILRGFSQQELVDTVEAMSKGGIHLVEVTFDQSGQVSDEDTADNIRLLVNTFAGKVRVGAGTVMTERQVDLAYEAGAEFIISPDTYQPVIEKTRQLGMVSIPGAITPSEAANAHRWGADFVKLFPNSEVSVSYLKALITPLSHIKFLAVGGVNTENIKEYFSAGAKGIGVATAIANKSYIKTGNYDAITELARAFVQAR